MNTPSDNAGVYISLHNAQVSAVGSNLYGSDLGNIQPVYSSIHNHTKVGAGFNYKSVKCIKNI